MLTIIFWLPLKPKLPQISVEKLFDVPLKISSSSSRFVHHVYELRLNVHSKIPEILLKSWHSDGMLYFIAYKLIRISPTRGLVAVLAWFEIQSY